MQRFDVGDTLNMSINVSARQLRDCRLPEDVHDAIAAVAMDPQRIVLEITETMLVHDPVEVAVALRSLKALGVRIAIDDFGTGYSSMSYLKDLPIDILKVDKSFVSSLGARSTDGHDLLRGILNLARALGLRTIAEGVEQSAHADLLVEGGCDSGQGFLWSRALTPEDAATLLATRAHRESGNARDTATAHHRSGEDASAVTARS
jgi:EAL domain-containing protein (putative c-di-GMP-specific phosphodiesterase class I)